LPDSAAREHCSVTRRPSVPISRTEIETFRRDGVVCLRGVMPQAWLERMMRPLDDALASPATTDLSQMADALTAGTGATRLVDERVAVSGAPRGHFLAGTDHWRVQPEFLEFALHSPLPAIIAVLLGSAQVWLYEDSVLVKEPGSQERTAWHQDMAYFALAGDLVATTWVPFDPVTSTTGAVRYVAGSHRDRTRYRPNTFVTDVSFGDDADVDVPDYDEVSLAGAARIVCFDTEPGDVVVHHARTIHGAGGNASATTRRRAISVRYAGDGTTYAPGSASVKPHHESMRAGEALDPTACPVAWPPAEDEWPPAEDEWPPAEDDGPPTDAGSAGAS
jgi:ectoine hydroxylase-related dioxygenase (phytanoyl-CoA dioxygenase family)